MKFNSFTRKLLLLCLLAIAASTGRAQNDKPEFLDLHVVKLNPGLLFVNELKFSYERQLAPKASLEFSASYVFKNDYWYRWSDEMVLSRGFALEASFRRYFDKKRYIFQPFFRSYISVTANYKHTSYDSLWFVFQGADATEDECTLSTKKFDFFGMRMLFGLQKRSGRFVLDMYAGLGLRATVRNFNHLARNLNGNGCEIIPGVTQFTFPNQSGVVADYSPTIHAGVKIGIRLGSPGKKKPGGNTGEAPSEN